MSKRVENSGRDVHIQNRRKAQSTKSNKSTEADGTSQSRQRMEISDDSDDETAANRRYKDSLFRMIFGEKEALLSLYNAVNETHHTNVEGLRINTLEDAVFVNMKNDISFIFDFRLSLYEHQSTDCGNMPLRYLFYVSRLLRLELGNKSSLYSSKQLQFPSPMFVVFYNGTADRPERWIEKLSEAFELPMELPKLELEVLFLNVNYGQNRALMEQCRLLEEYAVFVSKVRTYAERMSAEKAVRQAVEECMNEGILAEFLEKHRQEAIRLSILEYNEERDLKIMRMDEREIGEREGLEKGIGIGEARGEVRGTLKSLYGLVQDGIITLEQASYQINVSAVEFKEKLAVLGFSVE